MRILIASACLLSTLAACNTQDNVSEGDTLPPPTDNARIPPPPTGNNPIPLASFVDLVPCDEVNLLPVVDTVIHHNADGVFDENDDKIIGGSAVAIGDYPSTVRMYDENQTFSFCGGVLVAENIVLSAAHCFADSARRDVSIRAGIDDLNNTGEVITGTAYCHSRYDRGSIANDIALVRLDRPSTQAVVDRVEAGEAATLDGPGAIAFPIGWGKTDTAGSSRYLLSTRVTLEDAGKCQGNHSTERRCSSTFNSTTGQVSGVCFGDSGGPIYTPDGEVLGVMSFVAATEVDANGFPRCDVESSRSVYTSTRGFSGWISTNVAALSR